MVCRRVCTPSTVPRTSEGLPQPPPPYPSCQPAHPPDTAASASTAPAASPRIVLIIVDSRSGGRAEVRLTRGDGTPIPKSKCRRAGFFAPLLDFVRPRCRTLSGSVDDGCPLTEQVRVNVNQLIRRSGAF